MGLTTTSLRHLFLFSKWRKVHVYMHFPGSELLEIDAENKRQEKIEEDIMLHLPDFVLTCVHWRRKIQLHGNLTGAYNVH